MRAWSHDPVWEPYGKFLTIEDTEEYFSWCAEQGLRRSVSIRYDNGQLCTFRRKEARDE